MSDVTLTVTGFVGTTPKMSVFGSGKALTSFRVAHTKRRPDGSGRWVDVRTTWFTVKVWDDIARNVAASLRKGDPVVVTGGLALDEWSAPDGLHTNLVIEARALGHDLTRGEASFRHTVHHRGQAPAETTAAPSGGDEAFAVPDVVGPDVAGPDVAGPDVAGPDVAAADQAEGAEDADGGYSPQEADESVRLEVPELAGVCG